MTLQKILEYIESQWFSAYINAASGLSVVLMEFEQNEVIAQLIHELQKSKASKHTVYRRLLELLPQNPEPEYAHPHDVTLAAYLYTLNQADGELAHEVAEQLSDVSQLWWARRLANQIQESAKAATRTQFVVSGSRFTLLHWWSPDTTDVHDVPLKVEAKEQVTYNYRPTFSTLSTNRAYEQRIYYATRVSKTFPTMKQGVM